MKQSNILGEEASRPVNEPNPKAVSTNLSREVKIGSELDWENELAKSPKIVSEARNVVLILLEALDCRSRLGPGATYSEIEGKRLLIRKSVAIGEHL